MPEHGAPAERLIGLAFGPSATSRRTGNQCGPEAPDLDVAPDCCLNQNQFGRRARNVTGSTFAPPAIVAADALITPRRA
jgi:hypothetical protein